MKVKTSTFDQIMAVRDEIDKKHIAFTKAVDKKRQLISRFPECSNKLFRYGGKTYVVTCVTKFNGEKMLNLEEVEE